VHDDDGRQVIAADHALGDGVRVRPLAPLEAQRLHLGPVRLGHGHPALAEVARARHQHPVARREQVGVRRLEGAGARGGEEHHVLRGAEDALEALEDAAEAGLELGGAMVRQGLRHGGDDVRRNRRRPWREQELLRRGGHGGHRRGPVGPG
jgi:hypothetical protein